MFFEKSVVVCQMESKGENPRKAVYRGPEAPVDDVPAI